MSTRSAPPPGSVLRTSPPSPPLVQVGCFRLGPIDTWPNPGTPGFGEGREKGRGAGIDRRPALTDIHERVSAVVEAFARGELIIVTDDDDRENEGDLFVAASLCTPEKMAFIIRNTSGIVCAPLTAQEAKRLHLDPMVAANDAPLGTAFTVSVDFRHGLTTGISAEERTNTVRALANGNVGAGDFVRPGHVFPLIAKEGGVLMRSGHTEACIDLCRLAGLAPVGVLAELMNDDGTVLRGAGVTEFAARHGLQCLSIADLIDHRQGRDKLDQRVGEFRGESDSGNY